jgi:ferredoxin
MPRASKCRRRPSRRGSSRVRTATPTCRAGPDPAPAGDMHDEIVLKHDEEHRWCLDCHDASDRDALHLASGEPVPFEESYRLCGQCHGEKYRDWRAGVHGRRTGSGTAPRSTCCARTATIRTSRASRRIAPLPAPTRPARGGGCGTPIGDIDGATPGRKPPKATRRQFASCAAAAAAGWLLTACGPRRLHEVPPERLRAAIRDGARVRREVRHRGHRIGRRPMPGVLFGYALDSRAASAAGAASTPASRRTTSRATRRCTGSASCDGEGQGDRLRACRPVLRAGDGAGGRALLRAGAVPAVPQRAVHEGVPDRRHVDREGRHRRDRLRLVHRLPLLHGGLPVRRAAVQLGRAVDPRGELNPSTHYLGNRPRPKGVVEKCTFCIQRVRAGRYPACVEVCPVGARKFGNLLDPDSEIRYILEHKRVLVLKQELNTMPKFFYFYGREVRVTSIRPPVLRFVAEQRPAVVAGIAGVLDLDGLAARPDRVGACSRTPNRSRTGSIVTRCATR